MYVTLSGQVVYNTLLYMRGMKQGHKESAKGKVSDYVVISYIGEWKSHESISTNIKTLHNNRKRKQSTCDPILFQEVQIRWIA